MPATNPSFESFGRVVRRDRSVVAGASAISGLNHGADGFVLPFGNGRSYGDSCHNDGGHIADMRALNRIVAFDAATGTLDAEPGVMLHDIIDRCAPLGWFLPVTPGTRFVTLGGAVANDVHGKNHHRRGTLGCHVEALTLERSDGLHETSRDNEPELFAATIGGMGLTGFITQIRLKLMKVGSPDVMETRVPFETLEAYFDQAEMADAENEYAVAWLDQLHGERGIVMTANHADSGDYAAKPHAPKLAVPVDLPFNVLNAWSLRAFNTVFHTAKARGAGHRKRTSWQSYFYPLDAVGKWNRLYGPKGLFQHQSVIPFDEARSIVPALLQASRDAGEVSFLTVLKRFGDVASPGLMSFPQPGYTLTLDFPNRGQSTRTLLDLLDAITMGAGGRVNPYKDARMSPETFKASFPHWEQMERWRDPAIISDFWKRCAFNHDDGDGG